MLSYRRRNRAQLRLRLRAGDARSHTGNDVDHEGRVAVDRWSTNRQVIAGNRRPDRRTAIVRASKAARGHADDGESQAVQPDGPSDDCRIRRQGSRPQVVANYDDRRRARRIVFRRQQPSTRRAIVQVAQIAAGHEHHARGRGCLGVRHEPDRGVVAKPGVEGYARRALPKQLVFRIPPRRSGTVGIRAHDTRSRRGIDDASRSERDGVQEAED